MDSKVGEFVFQSTLHSLIVALVVEALIRVWDLRLPATRLRFRLMVLLLPLIFLPLAQLAFPFRNTHYFRENMALFEMRKWLLLPLWDGIPLWYPLVLLMGLSSVLFLLQEVAPLVRRRSLLGVSSSERPEQVEKLESALKEISQAVGYPPPRVFLLDGEEPVAYVTGFRNHALMFSRSLFALLDFEELKGILAHEIAHMTRRDNWKGWLLALLRTLMFYNPVVLIVFRRILYENEKLCDDIAISITNKPLALASSLLRVFRMTRKGKPHITIGRGGLLSIIAKLEEHSQRVMVEDRVTRILHSHQLKRVPYEEFRMALTFISLAGLLYFVV